MLPVFLFLLFNFLFTETVLSTPTLCPRASHTLKLCLTPGLLKGLPAWLHFQTASDALWGLEHNSITLSQLLCCWHKAVCAARCQSAHAFHSQPANYFMWMSYQVWNYMQLDCFMNNMEDEFQDQTEAAQHLPNSWLPPTTPRSGHTGVSVWPYNGSSTSCVGELWVYVQCHRLNWASRGRRVSRSQTQLCSVAVFFLNCSVCVFMCEALFHDH